MSTIPFLLVALQVTNIIQRRYVQYFSKTKLLIVWSSGMMDHIYNICMHVISGPNLRNDLRKMLMHEIISVHQFNQNIFVHSLHF